MSWKDRAQEVRSSWKDKAIEFDPKTGMTPEKAMQLSESNMAIPKAAAYGAVKGLTLSNADEIYGGVNKLLGNDYTQARDEYRKNEAMAIAEEPLAGYASEMIGSAPYALIPGVTGAMATGALYGAGAANEAEDIPVSALGGATAAGLTHGALGLLKKPFEKPEAISARIMGASKNDLSKTGKFNPKEIAKDLKKTGVLNPRKVKAEIKVNRDGTVDLKFVGNRKMYNPDISDEENILNSVNDAIGKLDKKAKEVMEPYIDKHGTFMPEDLLKTNELGEFEIPEFERALEKYKFKAEGDVYTKEKKVRKLINDAISDVYNPKIMPEQAAKIAEEEANLSRLDEMFKSMSRKEKAEFLPDYNYERKILEKRINELKSQTNRGSTLRELNNIKRAWQNKAKDAFGTPDKDSQLMGQFYEDLSTGLKKFIENKTEPAFGNINDKISKLKSIQEMLKEKIAQQEASGYSVSMGVSPINTGVKEGVAAAKTPPFSNFRQWAGNKINAIPQSIRAGAKRGASMALPMGFEQRKTIPDQLNEMKFPRSTQFFQDHEDLVLAKIAQVAPDLLDTVEQAYNSHRGELQDIVPALMKMAPHLFETDRYDRYDGKIQDPQKRILARKDILKDDRLSNTEKAKLINNLNKTGELDGYNNN